MGPSVAEALQDESQSDSSFSELAKDAAPLDKYYIPPDTLDVKEK